MAYDRQHIRLTASGTLGPDSGAQEIFTWSLKFAGTTTTNAQDTLADLDLASVVTAVRAFHVATNAFIHPDANLTSVKVAAIGVDGLYLTDPREEDLGPIASGGGAGPRYPNQVALCYSLRTVTNLGNATRGRCYIPLPTMVLSAQGRMSVPSDQLSARSEFVTMCDLLNENFGDASPPMVLSLLSKVGSGAARAVTQIRLGDVLDTIRSRRNALVESYAIQDLA